MSLPLLERYWRHYVLGFPVRVWQCVSPRVRPEVRKDERYPVDGLPEFHQIYIFGALGDKDGMIRFLRSEVTTRPNHQI